MRTLTFRKWKTACLEVLKKPIRSDSCHPSMVGNNDGLSMAFG